ncbi:MAG: YlmH/Sll1252 family protein [Bacillota bacterium]|nr:YlmH/Sll1252 family protein [Bacillota bacterium]
MNTRELSDKYAKSDDERLLIAKIYDLVRFADDRHTVCFSSFLTPYEQTLLKKVSEFKNYANINFDGGYADAERRIAVVMPLGFETEYKVPIIALTINYKGQRLSHRDILGSVLGLGIKRETIGDILDQNEPQIVFVAEKMADFLMQNAKKAGKAEISLLIASDDIEISSPNFKEISATVASLRIDSVISEGFSISRSKAVDAVKLKRVFLNYVEVSSPSKEVSEGDKISLRGLGKIRLAKVGGKSRKDRIFVTIERYV